MLRVRWEAQVQAAMIMKTLGGATPAMTGGRASSNGYTRIPAHEMLAQLGVSL